jgi:hypothetical protein
MVAKEHPGVVIGEEHGLENDAANAARNEMDAFKEFRAAALKPAVLM